MSVMYLPSIGDISHMAAELDNMFQVASLALSTHSNLSMEIINYPAAFINWYLANNWVISLFSSGIVLGFVT